MVRNTKYGTKKNEGVELNMTETAATEEFTTEISDVVPADEIIETETPAEIEAEPVIRSTTEIDHERMHLRAEKRRLEEELKNFKDEMTKKLSVLDIEFKIAEINETEDRKQKLMAEYQAEMNKLKPAAGKNKNLNDYTAPETENKQPETEKPSPETEKHIYVQIN